MKETVDRNLDFRVAMTTSCRDCDVLPKVESAGELREENGRRVQVMHNGLKVVAGGYHGDWTIDIIRKLRGHHEPQEELVFAEVLAHVPSGGTIVELGAFWAYYSMWFVSDGDQRRAVCLEPDPASLAVGRANASLNGLDLEFVNACAGGEDVESLHFASEYSGEVDIPQMSVPTLIERFGIKTLDVLHCDIQGAELATLEASRELLESGRIRFAVVSTHSMQISGDPLMHQRVLQLFKEVGGRVLVEHDVHESFSGDGLVVAYFGQQPLEWRDPKISFNRYSHALFRNPIYDLEDFRLVHEQANQATAHAQRTLNVRDVQLSAAQEELGNTQAALARTRKRLRRVRAELQRTQAVQPTSFAADARDLGRRAARAVARRARRG